MKIIIASALILMTTVACKTEGSKEKEKSKEVETEQEVMLPMVQIAGAMKNVMWKGELAGIINLDTISNKTGLYGLGPIEFLRGELMINDGNVYVSKVLSDSTMVVEQTSDIQAPFFVYGNNVEWEEEVLPEEITNIAELQTYIDEKSKENERPFVFKLIGRVDTAQIHIQNLADGATVSSPKEAHAGQVNYQLGKSEVEIVGFFSTEHQGVFTHHDSFLHMHLITSDKSKMGHLDNVLFENGGMKLYLPKN